MRLYHASREKIDKFYKPFGGLHFGPEDSALQAALRHPSNHGVIYLHLVDIDTKGFVESHDEGCAENWDSLEANSYEEDGIPGVWYQNEWEPSYLGMSICLWDLSRIQRIISVEPIYDGAAYHYLEELECAMGV